MALKKYKYVNVDVLIGKDTVLTGDLLSQSAIKIDGKVCGNIKTDCELILSETGLLEGNAEADSLIISGKLLGDAKISGQLLIKETGCLEGNIEAGSLVIEAGGQFYGMNRSARPAKAETELSEQE